MYYMHLAIDLYIKLLKQVETHVNSIYFSQIFLIKTLHWQKQMPLVPTFKS